MTTLYIIEFGNVLINEDPSDIDDVDSIWFGVMSFDTGIDFEERLICSKTKKKTNKKQQSVNIENNGLKL